MGSPRVRTATVEAEKNFRAQLKVEWPISWGIAANMKNKAYVRNGYPKKGTPTATVMEMTTIDAAV
jgi:N-acetylneuraminic acid mutarotase